MDKRNLVFFFIFILIFNIGLSDQIKSVNRRKKVNGNINKFVLAPFSHVVQNDSIKVITFIEVPYFSLQFIKLENKFTASYEASVSLKNKKGNEIGHKIWTDSIIVDSYLESKSNVKNRKHFTSFIVPVGQYELLGELQDNDTRKRGTKEIIIDFRNLKKKPSLMKPTFLLGLEGDWGFEKNLIPSKGWRVREIGKGIHLLMSGFVKSEPYIIDVWVSNLNKKKYHLTEIIGDGNNGYFSETIFISSENLNSLKNDITIELEQNGNIEKSEIAFSTYKPGISNYVDDLDRALKQMKYILTNDERNQFKGKNRNEKRQLFYDLWRQRDPTPETEYNELMEEYYSRVWYANENFNAWAPGWETDMGMIYILFGPPDEIQRSNPIASNLNMLQVWHYYRLNKQFIFRDKNGFGDFRLDSPIFGDVF